MSEEGKRVVLFINHSVERCGVYQFGKRVGNALVFSSLADGEFVVRYFEADGNFRFLDGRYGLVELVERFTAVAVIWNFHPSTLGPHAHWINMLPGVKHIALAHECQVPAGFAAYVVPDPVAVAGLNEYRDHPAGLPFYRTGRLVDRYEGEYPVNRVPVIGSFGFGFGNKGYGLIVEKVCHEFDEAIIRLHIPFAHFGDDQGASAMAEVEKCREIIHHEATKDTKKRIKLEVSHEFMPEGKLLSWLAGNDLNVFWYDHMYGRGCASTLDYALAVRRPIGLSSSYMFRHLLGHTATGALDIPKAELNFAWEQGIQMDRGATLRGIMERGSEPLDKYRELWSAENLCRDWERILSEVIGQ